MKKKKFTNGELEKFAEYFENFDIDQWSECTVEENEITRAFIERNLAQDRLVVAIQSARDAGLSWAKVARMMGISAQAAHKRYGPLMSQEARAS